MKLITDALLVAGQPGSPISSITGDNCTRCNCNGITNLRNLADSNGCVNALRISLENIARQSVTLDDIESLVRDPWGSPYQLDENEGEVVGGNACRIDHISTVGADGIRGNADDFIVQMPSRTAACN